MVKKTAERQDEVDKVIESVDSIIPQKYRIDPDTWETSIKKDEAQVLLWPQIGKLYALRATRSTQKYLAVETNLETGTLSKTSLLWDIAENYLWSLQYSSLYSEEYRDLRKVKSEIYSYFKEFSRKDLKTIAGRVIELESKRKPESGYSQFHKFLVNSSLWYGD